MYLWTWFLCLVPVLTRPCRDNHHHRVCEPSAQSLRLERAYVSPPGIGPPSVERDLESYTQLHVCTHVHGTKGAPKC